MGVGAGQLTGCTDTRTLDVCLVRSACSAYRNPFSSWEFSCFRSRPTTAPVSGEKNTALIPKLLRVHPSEGIQRTRNIFHGFQKCCQTEPEKMSRPSKNGNLSRLSSNIPLSNWRHYLSVTSRVRDFCRIGGESLPLQTASARSH